MNRLEIVSIIKTHSKWDKTTEEILDKLEYYNELMTKILNGLMLKTFDMEVNKAYDYLHSLKIEWLKSYAIGRYENKPIGYFYEFIKTTDDIDLYDKLCKHIADLESMLKEINALKNRILKTKRTNYIRMHIKLFLAHFIPIGLIIAGSFTKINIWLVLFIAFCVYSILNVRFKAFVKKYFNTYDSTFEEMIK